MSTLNEYISAVKTQRDNLAANLNTMGVEANNSETLNTLVPKVLDIKSEETGENVFDDIVRFYDYNGDLLYEYTLDEIQSMAEMPAPPNHEYLVFQEWNCSLDALKSLTTGADVGAVYTTVDGFNKFVVNIPEDTYFLEITVTFQKSGYVSRSINVEWGDNTDIDVETILEDQFNGALLLSHTYNVKGRYVISITADILEGLTIDILSHYNNDVQKNLVGVMCEAYLCNQFAIIDFMLSSWTRYVCVSKELALFYNDDGWDLPSGINFFVYPSTFNANRVSGGPSVYSNIMPPIFPLGIQQIPEGAYLKTWAKKIRIPKGTIQINDTIVCNHLYVPSECLLTQLTGYSSITFEKLHTCMAVTRYTYIKNISEDFTQFVCMVPAKIKFLLGITEIFGTFAGIESVSIPASCVSMFNSAFDATYLTTIYSYAINPPSISTELDLENNSFHTIYIFPSGYHPIKIYVPSGCAASYQASDWGSIPMAEFIEME